MKKLASVIVATYHRPQVLGETLEHLLAMVRPEGWDLEVVVCMPTNDSGYEVARSYDVRIVHGPYSDVGSQTDTAAFASEGELLLRSGDDDLHPPTRLIDTVRAYEQGHPVIGMGAAYMFDPKTAHWATWDGETEKLGTNSALARNAFFEAGGFGRIDKIADGHLRDRLRAAGYGPAYDLRELGANWPVCLHLEDAISHNRPWPPPGEVVGHGHFQVQGRSIHHVAEYLAGWPEAKASLARIVSRVQGRAFAGGVGVHESPVVHQVPRRGS